jgi:hypothetical protein
MQKWEYLMIVFGADEPAKLARLGEEGWELVSAVPTDPEVMVYNFFFKRPAQPKPIPPGELKDWKPGKYGQGKTDDED